MSEAIAREKRSNGILEMSSITMLSAANLPPKYWGDAMSYAAWLHNRKVATGQEKTPYELTFGGKPDISRALPFGQLVQVLIPAEHRTFKLQVPSQLGRFLGFASGSTNYHILLASGKVIVSKDVKVLSVAAIKAALAAKEDPLPPLVDDSPIVEAIRVAQELEESPVDPVVENVDEMLVDAPSVHVSQGQEERMEVDETPISQRPGSSASIAPTSQKGVHFGSVSVLGELGPSLPMQGSAEKHFNSPDRGRPTRTLGLPSKLQGFEVGLPGRVSGSVPGKYQRTYMAFSAQVKGGIPVPATQKEAYASPHAEQWKEAERSELQQLLERDTWVLKDPEPGEKVIGNKWVYDVKLNCMQVVEKFKARLVAQGFGQQEGIDFAETFAPVSSATTQRSFLAMIAHYGWDVSYLDVKGAFLYGKLSPDEWISMRQPPGYKEGDKVCQLRGSL